MSSIQTSKVKLCNGVEMPWLGLGVFRSKEGQEVENAVKVDPNLTSPNFGAQQAETQAPAATQAPAEAPAKK